MQEGKEKIAHFGDFFAKELKGLVKNAGIKFRRNRQSDGYKTEENGYKTEEDGYKTEENGYKTEEDGYKTEEAGYNPAE